jgi:hypothetical protein
MLSRVPYMYTGSILGEGVISPNVLGELPHFEVGCGLGWPGGCRIFQGCPPDPHPHNEQVCRVPYAA